MKTERHNALILRANGQTETRYFQLAARPSYSKLAEILDPIIGGRGEFERVNVLYQPNAGAAFYTDLFVDECGRLKNLPHNAAATAIYRNNAIVHMGAKAEDLADIRGDAVLFLRRVWF